MISTEIQIRVRYNETDSMGYVYHGNYPAYYHVARTELLRMIGINDKFLEEHGILMPVVKMTMNFIQPAFYDDELTIKVSLLRMPQSKFEFSYKIYRQKQLINTAESTLAFVHVNNRKPVRVPQIISDKLQILYEN